MASIRRFMDARDYLEVETPILLAVAAGANARPFITQHYALSRTLYLRIATELYLKRCIIGGMDRVYEIGRIFRNEGLDATHNPEFTTMESYEAYADYNDIMSLVETLVSSIAVELLGTTKLAYGDVEIDVKAPWARLDLRTGILQYSGIDIDEHRDAAALAGRMREIGVVVTQEDSWGRLVDKLLERQGGAEPGSADVPGGLPRRNDAAGQAPPGQGRLRRAVRGVRRRDGGL